MEADRAFALRYAKNKDVFLVSSEEKDEPLDWTRDGIRHAFLKNKYLIVGGVWVSVVVGTLVWNFGRRDISRSQKLINARMTGQAAALLGVVAFGGVNALEERESQLHQQLEKTFDGVVKRKNE